MGQGLDDARWQVETSARAQAVLDKGITKRLQLEDELKKHGRKVVLSFLYSDNAKDAVKKIFETISLVSDGIPEVELEETIVVNALVALRKLAVNLSPADLEVSTTIDLVMKGS